mmetsp:Transcript_42822/g.99455  ORF Transcript_42822/g.99455 Transcript_42822/m.99455 type:complete len:212 (-) Transcript_42822:527-1162(-)
MGRIRRVHGPRQPLQNPEQGHLRPPPPPRHCHSLVYSVSGYVPQQLGPVRGTLSELVQRVLDSRDASPIGPERGHLPMRPPRRRSATRLDPARARHLPPLPRLLAPALRYRIRQPLLPLAPAPRLCPLTREPDMAVPCQGRTLYSVCLQREGPGGGLLRSPAGVEGGACGGDRPAEHNPREGAKPLGLQASPAQQPRVRSEWRRLPLSRQT